MSRMDNIQDKMGDEAKARFEELKSKQQSGQLNDKEREEFNKLRQHMGKE